MNYSKLRVQIASCLILLLAGGWRHGSLGAMSAGPRQEVLLDTGWRSVFDLTGAKQHTGFENAGYDDRSWDVVDVPHNWDDYWEVRRVQRGALHGVARYRRIFDLGPEGPGRRVFLYFEGVSPYASVWVNGSFVGKHAGGRTTFTLDITDAVHYNAPNVVAVEADDPDGIEDLPWVDGGEMLADGSPSPPGFSEGSQPVGIFRPVHLITTGSQTIEPFGVHVWNDDTATSDGAALHIETDIQNNASVEDTDTVDTKIIDESGLVVADLRSSTTLAPGASITLHQDTATMTNVHVWSPDDPYLYTVETTVYDKLGPSDFIRTPFGIRVISWPAASGPFLINGKPFFINGVAEYEHLLGGSQAFSGQQVDTTVHMVEAAGFNAFRDAHQPHNLRFQAEWDQDGILWWPQFCSAIWFDNPAFRANFLALLKDWVRERRNSPSLILWGLSNESHLPTDFAAECTSVIHQMDPTSPSQRLVTTCNGGTGIDWNIPQDWSGTYGGNLANYPAELINDRLVGEYGAWRSSGSHAEGQFDQNGPLTEDRFTQLLETKVRLAESVRSQTCGQFMWLLNTHENPGRVIGIGDATQSETTDADANIGPVNNKGIFTLWGQPTDAFYMYRANYVSPKSDPMVAIVSHTWPDRWSAPGVKDNIVVYSNCDSVALFNDYKSSPLGTQTRSGIGTHFTWNGADIKYNVLYAEGMVGGKVVATDTVVLNNLPVAPHLTELNGSDLGLIKPRAHMHYLYRVNCGGQDYIDTYGDRWLADQDFSAGRTWGSVSWSSEFTGLNPRLASEGATTDPIVGTRDQALFQSFRYGRAKLHYLFALPNGSYDIDLFFTEPWYGCGGGNFAGWRLFDTAVNGRTVLHDLDIWRESGGYAHALKKTVHATVTDGWLDISFPRTQSEEAVISAIAIASPSALPAAYRPAPLPATLVPIAFPAQIGDVQPSGTGAPAQTYPAAAAILAGCSVVDGVVHVAGPDQSITWLIQAGAGGQHPITIDYQCSSPITAELSVSSTENGSIVDSKTWTIPRSSSGTWAESGPPEGLAFNAGQYQITLKLTTPGAAEVQLLTVY